jgi:hypothetical protein
MVSAIMGLLGAIWKCPLSFASDPAAIDIPPQGPSDFITYDRCGLHAIALTPHRWSSRRPTVIRYE